MDLYLHFGPFLLVSSKSVDRYRHRVGNGSPALLKNLPERLDIRVDWAFKHFFAVKEHLIKIIKDLLDCNSDLKEQWCWIFNNLSNFAARPEFLDPSFDDIINDSGTKNLTMKEKLAYMEARTLSQETSE